MFSFIEYSFLGVFAGLVAGLLGVGGGIIIVPILVWLLPDHIPTEAHMHVAIATSLAVIVPTSIASTWKHQNHANIDWPVFRMLVWTLALGGIAGALLASVLPRNALQISFGVFEIIVAASLLFDRRSEIGKVWQFRAIENRIVGFAIGALSSVLGVGGGTMSVPYLNWRGLPLKRAIGTSAACGLPIAVTAVIAWAFTHRLNDIDIQYATGYLYWPAILSIGWTAILFAPVGAMLSQKLPINLLRHAFALVLLAVAVRLFWSIW